VSSIVVTLQHGACVFLGGTFEPAYVLAVHALPDQIQTVTNKRNAALLQRHLESTLCVPASRGLVRFVGVPEECLACDGRTIAGELSAARSSAVTDAGVAAPSSSSPSSFLYANIQSASQSHDIKIPRQKALRVRVASLLESAAPTIIANVRDFSTIDLITAQIKLC
jgi:hypothetical protein